MGIDLTTKTAAELGELIRESRRTGDKALRLAIDAEAERRVALDAAKPVERPVVAPAPTVRKRAVPKWVEEGDERDREAYRRQQEDARENARLRRQARREFTGVSRRTAI